MVYLNPDTYAKEASTSWMNPILAPGMERNDWEAALLKYIKDGSKFSRFSSSTTINLSFGKRTCY